MFAAIHEDGSATTWPSNVNARYSPANAVYWWKTGPVAGRKIVDSILNSHAVCMLREDGSVTTWGNRDNGGYGRAPYAVTNPGSNPVVSVVPNCV